MSSKAESKIKNIIKIAIGDQKKKKKKRGKKKPSSKNQEVREIPSLQLQALGNIRNLSGGYVPSTNSLLNIGREFRDVQLAQKQLSERLGISLIDARNTINREVRETYNNMARALSITQTSNIQQRRDIENITRQLERALGLSTRTAKGLEEYSSSSAFQQAVRTALNTILPSALKGYIGGEEGGRFTGFKGGAELLEAEVAKEALKKVPQTTPPRLKRAESDDLFMTPNRGLFLTSEPKPQATPQTMLKGGQGIGKVDIGTEMTPGVPRFNKMVIESDFNALKDRKHLLRIIEDMGLQESLPKITRGSNKGQIKSDLSVFTLKGIIMDGLNDLHQNDYDILGTSFYKTRFPELQGEGRLDDPDFLLSGGSSV